MIVMEKSRDIAILKTLGAKDSSIRKIFLYQGFFIGATGTALGSVLGVLGCLGLREYQWQLDESVFAISTVPVHFSPANFVTVAIAGLLITALAGVYPARRASKLRVSDALRYE
jgi:lipoprotein-releasing system permease protein